MTWKAGIVRERGHEPNPGKEVLLNPTRERWGLSVHPAEYWPQDVRNENTS
jgi:hypothetical protein